MNEGKLKKLLNQLDANSGTALFVLLVNVLGIFWLNAVKGRQTDSGLITYALGVVAAKTSHGIFSSKDIDKTDQTNGTNKQ